LDLILNKDLFGYLSLACVALSGTPYIISVLKGKTHPHVFTWFLWGVITLIAAAGQQAANAGPGAWATFLQAIFSIITFVLCFSHGDRSITKADWVALIIGLSALPLWLLTSNPFWAVGLVTLIDAIAYAPTLRKSYGEPDGEMASSYIISNVKHLMAIFAIVDYSLTTLIYPVILFFMNSWLIAVILWRRRALRLGSA
jgi:hypothetical protein